MNAIDIGTSFYKRGEDCENSEPMRSDSCSLVKSCVLHPSSLSLSHTRTFVCCFILPPFPSFHNRTPGTVRMSHFVFRSHGGIYSFFFLVLHRQREGGDGGGVVEDEQLPNNQLYLI